MLNKKIYLTGFMGCGKTTVANLISKYTGLKALDSDIAIENLENLKLEDIFKIYGELFFRRLEFDFFKDTVNLKNIIVSTGGGSFIENLESYRIVQRRGLLIFLDSSFENCFRRIEFSRRPLVLTSSKKQLNYIFNLRRPIYKRMADIVVSSDFDIAKTCFDILHILSFFGLFS